MRIVTLTVIGTLVLGTLAVVHARQGRRASPHESISGTIDGTDITITYGRPSMRGRMIFGRLVAWDRVWCPGADEATTLAPVVTPAATTRTRSARLSLPPDSRTTTGCSSVTMSTRR